MTELRPARPSDAGACAGILQDWLDATPWMPKLHTLAETEQWMAQTLFPSAETWVMEEESVKGFLALQDRAEIAQLVLSPLARGKGYGHQLIETAKSRAPVGLSLWCFAANGPALRFYAREGFTVIGGTEGANDEGLADLQLAWRRG